MFGHVLATVASGRRHVGIHSGVARVAGITRKIRRVLLLLVVVIIVVVSVPYELKLRELGAVTRRGRWIRSS